MILLAAQAAEANLMTFDVELDRAAPSLTTVQYCKLIGHNAEQQTEAVR